MSGAWLAEEAYAEVIGWGSQGEMRSAQGPPGRTAVLDDDESCWHKLGKGEFAHEDRGNDGWQAFRAGVLSFRPIGLGQVDMGNTGLGATLNS